MEKINERIGKEAGFDLFENVDNPSELFLLYVNYVAENEKQLLDLKSILEKNSIPEISENIGRFLMLYKKVMLEPWQNDVDLSDNKHSMRKADGEVVELTSPEDNELPESYLMLKRLSSADLTSANLSSTIIETCTKTIEEMTNRMELQKKILQFVKDNFNKNIREVRDDSNDLLNIRIQNLPKEILNIGNYNNFLFNIKQCRQGKNTAVSEEFIKDMKEVLSAQNFESPELFAEQFEKNGRFMTREDNFTVGEFVLKSTKAYLKSDKILTNLFKATREKGYSTRGLTA